MKRLVKTMIFAVAAAATIAMTACATPYPLGVIYTRVTVPVTTGNGEIAYDRVGQSSCISILGLFASGDASINQACKEGGIRKVSWVNQDIQNILGIYGSYKTTVYGYAE